MSELRDQYLEKLFKQIEIKNNKDTSDTFINNQNILTQIARETNSNTESKGIENQETINSLLSDSIKSSSLNGEAYSSSKKLKEEIEDIEKQIRQTDKAIALDIRDFESSSIPFKQEGFRKSIEIKEEQKAKLVMLRNAKIQEFRSALTADQANVENAFIHSEYPTNNNSNNNSSNNTVNNNVSKKNNSEFVHDPNNTLFRQTPTNEELAALNAAFLDLLNTSKTNITKSGDKYKAENFLLGGGQWLYDKMLEKAKSQGEDPTKAFLKDSDTIRGYLEKISANPEIMALVEIAAQQGIKSDDQMLSLIFDTIEFDHDRFFFNPNDFHVSAEKTLQGIQNIKQGNFSTEAARRIIDRLRLKGKEEQLANSLVLGSGR